LIDREVEVSIRRNRKGIYPVYARIPHKRAHAAVGRVVDDHGLLLRVTKIDQAIRIGLEPITRPLLRQTVHASLGPHLTRRSLRPQQRSRDTIQITPARRSKEKRMSITAQRNPIRAKAQILLRLSGHEAVNRLTPDERQELKLRVGARVAVEVAPGVAGGEVDDDEPVVAFGGGVGYVGDAGGVGGGEVGAEIEADVVEVGVALWVLAGGFGFQE